MVIIVPQITKVIRKAEKETMVSNIGGVVRAANYEFKRLQMEVIPEYEIIFTFKNGVETSNVDGAKLEYDGDKIKNGVVKINEAGGVTLAIHNGTYCVEKWYTTSKIEISEKSLEECKIVFPCGKNFVDPRDNKEYKTTKIGDQCWFAENLKYTKNGCLNKTWNGDSVGPVDACKANDDEIHYQWDAAMNGSTTEGAQGLCPSGWHIPTDAEWDILVDYVGGSSTAGKKLKAVAANGTDDYGFNGMLVGRRNTVGDLNIVGSGVLWWSSSLSETNAWRRSVGLNSDAVYRGALSKAYGFSVRCVLD